jgi:hypothetical protein
LRVDEARQHPPALVVAPLPAVAGGVGLHAGYAAVFDPLPVVGANAHARAVALGPRRRGGEVEQVAAQGDALAHRCFSGAGGARRRATSRTRSRSQRSGGAAWLRSCHNWY